MVFPELQPAGGKRTASFTRVNTALAQVLRIPQLNATHCFSARIVGSVLRSHWLFGSEPSSEHFLTGVVVIPRTQRRLGTEIMSSGKDAPVSAK